jgi:hypothetical protein
MKIRPHLSYGDDFTPDPTDGLPELPPFFVT